MKSTNSEAKFIKTILQYCMKTKPISDLPVEYCFDRGFHFLILSWGDWDPDLIVPTEFLDVYTNGSKLNSGIGSLFQAEVFEAPGIVIFRETAEPPSSPGLVHFYRTPPQSTWGCHLMDRRRTNQLLGLVRNVMQLPSIDC